MEFESVELRGAVQLIEYIYIYIPRPSKGNKFQPKKVLVGFLGPKLQTFGGFRYIYFSLL